MVKNVKPSTAVVFSILNIVFGGIWALLNFIGFIRYIGVSYTGVFGSLLDLGVNGLLIYAGVCLMQDRNKPLMMNQYYIAASVFVTVAVYIAHKLAHLPASTLWLLFGLVYPVVVLVFLVNSDEVKKYYVKAR